MIDEFDRFRYAQRLYEKKRYQQAARELEGILDAVRGTDLHHGVSEVELLLARSYYRSAQLDKAERAIRAYLLANPDDGYAYLLLGRTLQRLSRHDEARSPLRVAQALGVAAGTRG